MRIYLVLIIAVAYISCGDGSYDFKTVATYQATASSLNVALTAVGHVYPNEDLGDGFVKAKISSSKFSDTIYLQSRAEILTSLNYKNDTIAIKKPYDIAVSLMHCLDTIGYSDYDILELIEFSEAIQSTAYGPKGTYLKGQTKYIKVQQVDYKTY